MWNRCDQLDDQSYPSTLSDELGKSTNNANDDILDLPPANSRKRANRGSEQLTAEEMDEKVSVNSIVSRVRSSDELDWSEQKQRELSMWSL